jgi:ribosome-binding protein aMBF1 (putative translation factor)
MISYTTFKEEVLKDPAVCKEYRALETEHELTRTIIRQRITRGWTQGQLAERVGTRQPVISRIERGVGNPSLQTLKRIATALGLSLRVSMK